jgi:thiopurine S-methyltransferase
MDTNFWHERWAANDIGFHESEANTLLVKYIDTLSLAKGSRVFLPLCGKTLDIVWLLSKGFCVVGSELSKTAVKQLFEELAIEPAIKYLGNIKHYYAQNIDIFVGDIFDLTNDDLSKVDAIYDRAALVALPLDMRKIYTQHLMNITNNAPQLLINFEYDQSILNGPPFSISSQELKEHYSASYDLSLLESKEVFGGLKGKCKATENVWVLNKNTNK